MDDLIKSLPNVLRMAGDTPEVLEVATRAAWRHIAGDGLKQHTVPLRLEGRTLIVAVSDRIWQRQLTSMTGQLLFRLNSTLGKPLVSRIEIVVDSSMNVQTRVNEKPSTSSEVPQELLAAASNIKDPELRNNFLRAATASLERRSASLR